ncbi:hypothetical protein HDK77DRAFT_483849 [Phyllosticta capitalensis]
MPTHHGTRTKVSLIIADLDSTTTKEPENIRGHSEVAKRALERSENDFKNGRELKESFIPLDGDDFNTLHYLGQDAYMPFMMVRAGKELRPNPSLKRVYHPNPVRNAIYARVLGHSPADVIHTPHALAIRLDISEQTFLKTNLPANDMKIDIFFNGKFTNATTVPARSIKDKKPFFVFGGLRTHYMLERPWVVLPRDKNADGTQRRAAPRTETSQDRWNELAQAISEEVDLRATQGRTPVVEYLDALSKLPMPPEMDQWDERDTHRYSVIDVVLSYGHGRKDGANAAYLTKPTRLRPRPKASQGVPPAPVSRQLDDIVEEKLSRSISDIHIRKDHNVVTSSEQLPKYLTGAMEKAGLGVQTTAEQASRWSTASAMLKDVLDRGEETTKTEPSTPLRGLPPPISPPRSSLFTGSRLREVTLPSDFDVPDLKLPPAATPSSLVRDTSRMSLQSPSSRVTRSGNRYNISSGSPRKRRRTSSTSSASPTSIGISSRGIFTTAGSGTDLSTRTAPLKQFVHPDALMPPPLSPLKSFGDLLLETPKKDKSTRVVFKLGGALVRTANVPTRLLTSMPPPLTTPSRNPTPTPARRIARARPSRAKNAGRGSTTTTTATPYTLFPNPYTAPALASPFATTTTTPSTPPRSRKPRGSESSPVKASAERQAANEAAFRAFVDPPLARDAAVSYSAVRAAWRGSQWTQGMERGAGGGVVRQIRTERGGEFGEEGVVLGVRFVVF